MKPQQIVDLTMDLTNRTPVFPGDPTPHIYPAATPEDDGYSVHHLHIASHTGTHVDAPSHFFQNGARMDQLDLHLFIGRGLIIPVQGKQEQEPITLADTNTFIQQARPGDIVLFHTGWAQYVGTEKYERHPYIHHDVARALLDQGVRVIGIDALNPDKTGGDDFSVHEEVLGREGVLIENLTNLDAIDFPNPIISVLPLKLVDGDGSPVRAVAMEG
ncbi:cyclase family protein [Lentibacillus cibarius]|uniref:Cyclase family protein n=1 Tax=Lentibacillus cibarius TaxID=2583219 RepID=A0A5S3QIL6_9BACI|nr:cyclase family protein [Lentibacillus cibarius]TMN21762.1 cyclase family protein [Lentibacillus cibarius]